MTGGVVRRDGLREAVTDRERWAELGKAMMRVEINLSMHGRDFHEWYGECVERAARVLDAVPDDLQAQAWDEGYRARASLTRPTPDWRDYNPYRLCALVGDETPGTGDSDG